VGFHSVHIAASVGKGRGANGGFHAWPVDYTHPSNGGLGNDIKYLLEVGCALSIAGRRLEGLLIETALGIDLRVWWLVGCQHVSFLSSYIKQQLAGCIHVHAIDIDWSLTPPAFHRLTAASFREHFDSVRIATLSLCTRLPSLPHCRLLTQRNPHMSKPCCYMSAAACQELPRHHPCRPVQPRRVIGA
jgi:hypothetical protein